jgi:hypothetical protein
MSHMPLDLLHALATGCNHQGSVRNADLFSRAGCQISHDDYIKALRDGGRTVQRRSR